MGLLVLFAVLAVQHLVWGLDGRQLLADPGFEDALNASSAWQPYLSGFFLERSSMVKLHLFYMFQVRVLFLGRAAFFSFFFFSFLFFGRSRRSLQCRSGSSCVSLTPHHFFGFWQHVELHPDDGRYSVLSLSGWANAEWGYSTQASISIVFRFLDGSRASSSLSFRMGVPHYQRRCASYHIPSKNPIRSITVFGIASPESQNFGTVFFDDFEATLSDNEAFCGDDLPPRMPKVVNDAAAFAVVKAAPAPIAWRDVSGKARVCVVACVGAEDVKSLSAVASSVRDAPMVAAVYAPPDGATPETVFDEAVALVNQKARVVVVGNVLRKRRRDFPVNVLRVLGQENCPEDTTHAIYLEEGMMLSGTFWESLPASLDENAVLVVPAFEVEAETVGVVRDKAAIREMAAAKAGTVRPLQFGHHRLARYPTNYSHWTKCSEDYDVVPVVSGRLARELGRGVVLELGATEMDEEPPMFNRYYAPVMIVPRKHSDFDLRFSHLGHERVSFVASWHMRAGKFRVLCSAFVTRFNVSAPKRSRKPHPPALSSKRANQIWRTYYSFLGENLAVHTEAGPELAKLFRAMPFVSRDKDHRLDAPFWQRASLAFGTVFVAGFVLRQLLGVEKPARKTQAFKEI